MHGVLRREVGGLSRSGFWGFRGGGASNRAPSGFTSRPGLAEFAVVGPRGCGGAAWDVIQVAPLRSRRVVGGLGGSLCCFLGWGCGWGVAWVLRRVEGLVVCGSWARGRRVGADTGLGVCGGGGGVGWGDRHNDVVIARDNVFIT